MGYYRQICSENNSQEIAKEFMARIKLDLPERFVFSTEITVRIDDINYGGHLGNDSILSIIHEARMRFLKNFGFSELNVGDASLIMGDVAIVFKSEGFHGDIILVEMAAVDFSNSGFDIFYKLTNRQTGKDVAHAKTGMVCFDYKNRKVMAVPQVFKDAVSK